ncbi:protein of unknown function DUF262 [Candidatus Magnetoovum chiemensis]|nr:protein of unknown function DUF262 [Candidatus Magnetoovum chiemensis]
MVVDGLQRIHTIVKFLEGGDWKLSNLDDINPDIAGKSAAEIKGSDSDLKKYYQRVENLTLPITVLRCDHTNKQHLEYLFMIFRRLNTGGMKLNNQEIRNCIYGGTFNNLLKELDEIPSWHRINKIKHGQLNRFKKQELILRFFAFYSNYHNYKGKLAEHINEFMHVNRNISKEKKEEFSELFKETSNFIYKIIFGEKSTDNISGTIIEALFVGVAKNLDYLKNIQTEQVKNMYKKLLEHPNFSEHSLAAGLSNKDKVIGRLNAAITIFSGQES